MYEHPSRHLPRTQTTDIDRQNINIRKELAPNIIAYMIERQ